MALSASRSSSNLSFLRRSAETALRELHEAVLAPLEPTVSNARRLIVVPHGMLHQIPFECLHDGTDYLNQRMVIARAPTADYLSTRPRRHRRRSGEVVILGMVSGGPTSVRRELEVVSECFSDEQTTIIQDPGSQELLDRLPHSRLVHFSTHGVFRDDNPSFSRLTTKDGAVFVADLTALRLCAELVVLSACNSGVVFSGEGDDLTGLAHGLLAAGARRLVASLWRVHDAATLTTMQNFYRQYTNSPGGDAARALAEAAKETRREWDHPFFWGGFSLYGG
jgi:CHAT domain-containing protein